MRIIASDFYKYEGTKHCALYFYLNQNKIEEDPKPDPFAPVLEELGRKHELAHLESLGEYADLRVGSQEEREKSLRISSPVSGSSKRAVYSSSPS